MTGFYALWAAPALVAAGVLLVLVADALSPRGAFRWPRWVGLATLVGAGGVLGWLATASVTQPCLSPSAQAECLYQLGPVEPAVGLIAVGGAIASLLLLGRAGDSAVRVALMLASVAGALSVLISGDVITLIVSLEIATVPLIALAALRGTRGASRAAMSLLMTSLTSFALLVVGAALWLAATGTPTLDAAAVTPALADPARRPALILAALVAVAGIAFKLSLVPFHAWTPPIYREVDTAVLTLFVTTSKAAGVGAAVAVLRPLTDLDGGGVWPRGLVSSLALVALVSMVLAAATAFQARSALGFLAWSTISQAGWIVLPLAALSAAGVRASAAYLAVYAVATLVVVLAVGLVTRSRVEPASGALDLSDMRGLLRTDPVVGGALAFALLVLAGVPPGVVGLITKVMALQALSSAGLWPVAVLAAVGVVVGLAAYVRWLAVLVATPPEGEPRARGAGSRLVTGVLLALTAVLVLLSIAPGLLLDRLG